MIIVNPNFLDAIASLDCNVGIQYVDIKYVAPFYITRLTSVSTHVSTHVIDIEV